MESQSDPFAGVWAFSPARSQVSTAAPRTWIQRISASKSDVVVSEEIVRSDGSQIAVIVRARFDGRPYPVTGSPIVDSIAYTRVGPDTIIGTGTKDGTVVLKETLNVSAHGHSLTLIYSIYAGAREIATGTVVFEAAR
jgi:hypothetical protein